MFACVKKRKIEFQQCSGKHYSKKQTVNDQTTQKAQLKYLRKHLFLRCICTFLHTIPLRMINCSQGIYQKSVFYSFGNHPLTDSTNSTVKRRIHVLILATTSGVIHSCSFLFVLYIFDGGCLYCTDVLCEKFPRVATDSPFFLHVLLILFYC